VIGFASFAQGAPPGQLDGRPSPAFNGAMKASSLVLVALAVLASACQGAATTDTGAMDDVQLTDAAMATDVPSTMDVPAGMDAVVPLDARDTPTLEERQTFDRGAGSDNDLQRLLAVADSMFNFDPTLNPTMSAAANAMEIQRYTMTNLAGCGSVMVVGTTVTVSFGTGCTLMNGVHVSGSATLMVSGGMGSALTVAMSFASLTVETATLSGTASFVTSNGTTFTVTANLTSGTTTIRANLTVVAVTGAYTVTGTASQMVTGEAATALTFNSLHYVMGQCYPDGGSVTVMRGLITMTYTFSAMTPTTGQVSVTQGRRMYTMTLPPYGNCPPGRG